MATINDIFSSFLLSFFSHSSTNYPAHYVFTAVLTPAPHFGHKLFSSSLNQDLTFYLVIFIKFSHHFQVFVKLCSSQDGKLHELIGVLVLNKTSVESVKLGST